MKDFFSDLDQELTGVTPNEPVVNQVNDNKILEDEKIIDTPKKEVRKITTSK